MDVPVSTRTDATVGKEEASGILRVAGDFALFAIGTVVGGAIIRSGGRSIVNRTGSFLSKLEQSTNSVWLKKATTALAELKDEASRLSSTVKRIEGVAGEGKNAVSYFETLIDSEKFTTKGLNPDYVKRLAISRAAAYSRRAPYELPAAYITQRYIIEREQTKKDIQEGRFNPLNPLDTIGDFAIKSAGLVAADMVLHTVSPMGKAFDEYLSKTNANYLRNKTMVKVIGAQATNDLISATNKISMFSRATVKTITDLGIQSDIAATGLPAADSLSAGTGAAPLRSATRKSRTSVMEFGKSLAANMQEELRRAELYGRARNPAATVKLGNDLAELKYAFGEGGALESDSMFGLYTKRMEATIAGIENSGLSRQDVTDIMDLASKRMDRRKIGGAISTLGAGSKVDGLGRVFSFRTDSAWESNVTELLGKQKISSLRYDGLEGMNALNRMISSAGIAPDRGTAKLWQSQAKQASYEFQDKVFRALLDHQGRAKLDLRELPGRLSRTSLFTRDSMAIEAFDSLGINPWKMSRTAGRGQMWEAYAQAMGGIDNLEARTRTLLVSRGKAFDTPFGDFNMLGLKRMSVRGMMSAESERSRQLRGASTTFGTNAAMFGVNRDASYAGLGLIDSRFGTYASRSMLGDKGLYTNLLGNVVDARALRDAPLRALTYLDSNVKIPILGMNPTQMFGLGDVLRNRNISVKYQAPRGNFFERKVLGSKLDIDQPMMQVGKKTFASMQGKVSYIGDWTWFSNNRTSMATSNLRKMTGVPSEYERAPEQRRYIAGGKFLKNIINRVENSPKGKNSWQVRWLNKLYDGIDRLDFEQSAEKSLPHQGWRRLRRSGSLRYKIAKRIGATSGDRIVESKLPKPLRKIFSAVGPISEATRVNREFIPHFFDDVVEKAGYGAKRSAREGSGITTIRGGLASNWDRHSSSFMADMLDYHGLGQGIAISSARDVTMVDRAITQMEHALTQPNVPKDLRGQLQSIIKRTRNITGDYGIDPMHLDLSVGYGESADASDRIFHQVTQNLNEFYLSLARVNNKDEFGIMWDRIGQMRDAGHISEGMYQKLRSTMAAVEIRVGEAVTDDGAWMVDGKKASASALRVKEAINYLVGPSTTTGVGVADIYRRGAGEGRGIKGVWDGLMGVQDATFGSKGFFGVNGTIINDEPKARNPFSGQRWIGLPSFSSKFGLDQGFRELSNIVHGRFVNEVDDSGSNPWGSLAGSMLGKTKHSELTTATLAGTHIVGRVAEATDTLGFGLQGWKYKNPADLFLRGVMGKRALPAVLGLAAFDMVGGIPVIGRYGLMGAAATAIGPGFGMARSAVFGATGLNKAAGTFADVTNQDEDARSRKWARTPREEYDYWTKGDDPIRKGRYWILGNSRFKGNSVSYYRPNWWRTYMSDYKYRDTSDKAGAGSGQSLYGSRMERALYGYDFSPLRVLDPYHYENRSYKNRPYPVSGDYFTGPWGPLTPLLNATVGSVLKPKRLMHTEDMGIDGGPAQIAKEYLTSTTGAKTMLQAYESGRMNLGQIARLGVTGARMGDAYIEQLNQQSVSAGRGRGIRTAALVRAASRVADANVNTSATGGYSQAIVNSMNKLGSVPSGTPIAALGGDSSYSTGKGYIPAPFMYVMGKTPYPQRDTQVPQMSQAMKPGLLNYRLGEIGYMAQEWGGFYGFMFGAGRAATGFGERDMSPSGPMLQSADRMYGAERAFWDRELGGLGDFPTSMLGMGNIQMSEITRRFIPHKRNQITQVNDIPNTMPTWMPGASDVINYQTGDPYVKQKMGELRMPGAGYEAVNRLHPDAFGAYGAFDRFKILADLAPWSNEYNMYKKILEKGDLTDDMRHQVTQIKHQVAEKRKKIAVSEYMWQGRLGEVAKGEIGMSQEDPNLFIMSGQENPIRLAGVRFAKSPEGRKQAEAFYQTHLAGRTVSVKADKNSNPVLDNREKTLDAIVTVGGKNINKLVEDKIKSGELSGSMSQSKNYVDNMVRYSPGWQMLGKVWETVAHAEVPIISMKLGRQSAAEYYERRMVYGKQWQPWETPVKSYLQPMWETYTRDRGLFTIPAAAALTGWAAGMFFRGPGQQKTARIIGATIGGLVGAKNQLESLITGQRSVPMRRRHEWAMDEYVDILQYIKSANEYKAYRQAAIEREGVDPETIVAVLGESAGQRKDEFEKEWNDAPIGRKPDKPPANKAYANLGPLTAQALSARRKMSSTMYGFDMSDDYMTKTMGIPKRYQPLVEGWMNTPKNQQKKLLDILPRAVRRILEDRWGQPVEKQVDLAEYFKHHELPGPEWEGWMPEVNLDEIKMKMVKHEGLDAAEFGYYPNQMEDSLSQPWSYPELHGRNRLNHREIVDQLSAMGVMDVQVQQIPTQGTGQVIFNLMHDRTSEVASSLKQQFAG